MSAPRKGPTYGRPHRRVRARYAPLVVSGRAVCARCGDPIAADEPWDLGHVDGDPSRYAGPEHRRCNRATAGRQAQPGMVWSRHWYGGFNLRCRECRRVGRACPDGERTTERLAVTTNTCSGTVRLCPTTSSASPTRRPTSSRSSSPSSWARAILRSMSCRRTAASASQDRALSSSFVPAQRTPSRRCGRTGTPGSSRRGARLNRR